MTSSSTWLAEEAAINGFPPLRQVVFDGWLLRFSSGVRRTANSATPLREPRGDLAGMIASAEALYAAQSLPTIFRIPSFIAPSIDAQFAARGYTSEGESCMIEGPIDRVAGEGGSDTRAVRLSPHPTPEWLAAMARLQGQSPVFHAVYRQIVSSVALPAAFAELTVEGESAALAYGVIHRGMLCFESVVTDARHRRKGLSRRLLAVLASWGKQNGASIATLQVEADNAPARALYHSIGMTTELHRYHYRRQPS